MKYSMKSSMKSSSSYKSGSKSGNMMPKTPHNGGQSKSSSAHKRVGVTPPFVSKGKKK